MKTCTNCRHSVPVAAETANEMLVAGRMGDDAISLKEHPAFRELANVESWRLCKAHESLVPGNHDCEHHGSRLARLWTPVSKDRALYLKLKIRREIDRKAEILEHEQKTREAEFAAEFRTCDGCGFIHDKCKLCKMPWTYCATCSACGGGVSFRRLTGAWTCSLCERTWSAPTARIEWPGGLCDGCADATKPTVIPPETPSVNP